MCCGMGVTRCELLGGCKGRQKAQETCINTVADIDTSSLIFRQQCTCHHNDIHLKSAVDYQARRVAFCTFVLNPYCAGPLCPGVNGYIGDAVGELLLLLCK